MIDAFFSQMAGIQPPPPEPADASATFQRSRPPVGNLDAERQWLEEELHRLDAYMGRQFGLLRQQREEFARWRSEVEATLVAREQDLNRQDRLIASRRIELEGREAVLAQPASAEPSTPPVVQELDDLRQAIVEEQATLDRILQEAAEQCRQADLARAEIEQWQRDRQEQETLLQARHQQLADREDELDRKARHIEERGPEPESDDEVLPTSALIAEPSSEPAQELGQAIVEQQEVLAAVQKEVADWRQQAEQAQAGLEEWQAAHDEALALLGARETAVLSAEMAFQQRLAGLEDAAQVLAHQQQELERRQADGEQREAVVADLTATETRLLELKPLAESLQQEVDQQKALLQNIWQEAEKRVEETARVQLVLERQAEALHEREALVRARHQETEQRQAELNQAEPVLERRAQELREFERRIRDEFHKHEQQGRQQAESLRLQADGLEQREQQLLTRLAELAAQEEELQSQAQELARQRQEFESQKAVPSPLVAKLAEVNLQLREAREREQKLRASQDVRTQGPAAAPDKQLIARLAEVNVQLRDARAKLDQQAATEKRWQDELDRSRREVQERRQELREEMHKTDELQRKVAELNRRLGA